MLTLNLTPKRALLEGFEKSKKKQKGSHQGESWTEKQSAY